MMKRFVVGILALQMFPMGSSAGTIGLFSTPDCSSCSLRIPPGDTRMVYISLTTAGFPADVIGVSGAEFKVTGLPKGWIAEATPSDLVNQHRGDPFDHSINSHGAQVGFALPYPYGSCVNLYRARLTATTEAREVRLHVTMPLWNTAFQCPLVTVACEDSCSDGFALCVAGGEMLINADEDCRVDVHESSWSQIKLLYQD